MPILENIPIRLHPDEIRTRLRLTRDEDWRQVPPLIDAVQQLIEPKAFYEVSYIEKKLEAAIVLDGLRLKSRVLRKNLDPVERIFPYVVTIGNKFDERQNNSTDLLEKFYLDTIGNVALRSARQQLQNHLRSQYAIEKISSMAPGSLSDWPIEEQKPLFRLLGDVNAAIGVKLTQSFLMIPAKSVSGIYFPTEVSFYSCQLCPRERCESRKAKYSEKKAKEYGVLK